MKAKTSDAMRQLTQSIRSHIPFDELTEARVCSGLCLGCPKKLLEYLEQEVQWWESELEFGNRPTLGDVEKLARSGRKIHKILIKNQIL